MEPTWVGGLVDQTDPSTIVGGLRAVLSDEAGWRRVAEAGPEAVRDAFSVGRVGNLLREMYEGVLSTARS